MSDEITGSARPWRLADDLVLAEVEAQVLGIAREVAIGRYRIERELGQGGMGRLLLAFDPDLQRRVALKLVAPERASSAEARRRIVAEARAMARLSDPHVAQVYEVDEVDGQIFVAMEFVDGEDLRAWLRSARRTWREILAVFVEAGAGLAAAHDAGIVHRDFKPENVMISNRAKVVDFGLAGGEPRAREGSTSFGAGLTKTGAMLGTPAYMAPEQWAGATVDAKCDQFAFCVALCEAITGDRPFAGSDEVELRVALREAPRVTWPRSAPRWLWRAIERGLAHDPASRWSDMRALLGAIDPARRQRRAIAFGMAGLTVALVATAIGAAHDPCADAGEPIAQRWGEVQRAAVLDAAARTDPSWGEQSGARVVARLDVLADAWANAARASCAAPASPHNRGCASWTLARIGAAIDDAQRGDPALLVGAVARAELLPDPSSCIDAPALAAWSDPPHDDTRIVALLDEAERQLGALTVRGEPSVYRDATALARAAATEAIAEADAATHEPSLARALLVAGRIELGEGDHSRAESLLRRALATARRSNDRAIAAAASADLVYAVSRDRDRLREAEDLADEASAMIAALGDPPLLRARLLAHRASAIARGEGVDHGAAVALHEEVEHALGRELGAQHPATIVELGNIGAALGSAGRHDDAVRALEGALAQARVVWGDEHPRTAALLGALGLARMRAGALDESERDLRRSLALREAALGVAHPQVDDARYNLALLLRRRGNHAEAATLLHDGLAHVRSRRGEDDALLGPWWVAEGESLLELGEHERARFAFAAALRLFERTGASARDYARVRFAAARAWQDTDAEHARVLAEQARSDASEAKADVLVAEIDAWLAAPLR